MPVRDRKAGSSRAVVVDDAVPGPDAVYRRVVIGYTGEGWEFKTQASQDIINAYKLQLVRDIDPLRVSAFQLTDPSRTIPEVLAAFSELKAKNFVTYAEPNYVVRPAAAASDPLFDEQWAWRRMDAAKAWKRIQGSMQVEVAVVDSGIAMNHEDLVVTGAAQTDEVGHGTMVGGTIGAVSGNALGGKGVISPVRLLGIKFFDAHTWPTTVNAAAGIVEASTQGAEIICACWDVGYDSNVLRQALEGVPGILVVAAAGNDGSDNDRFPNWPPNYDLPNLITVMATDENDERPGFSNWGAKRVHIAAPGTRILSTYPYYSAKPVPPYVGYRYYSGTSASAAHAAGAAALVKALNPTWTPEQIKTHLIESVDLLPALAGTCVSGGRLNLARAVLGPLTVLKPAAGDVLAGNVLTDVFWTSSYKASAGRTVSISIEDTGGNWQPLANNVTNDGDFKVKLPAGPLVKTRIRVAGDQGNFPAISGTFKIT